MFKIVRNHITVQNKIDTEITEATDVIVTERNHNDKKDMFYCKSFYSDTLNMLSLAYLSYLYIVFPSSVEFIKNTFVK